MPTICKLLDDLGQPLAEPVVIDAVVSWRQADGIAQTFERSGQIITERRHARPDWIEGGGIRMVCIEPVVPSASAVRGKEWQYNPL